MSYECAQFPQNSELVPICGGARYSGSAERLERMEIDEKHV